MRERERGRENVCVIRHGCNGACCRENELGMNKAKWMKFQQDSSGIRIVETEPHNFDLLVGIAFLSPEPLTIHTEDKDGTHRVYNKGACRKLNPDTFDCEAEPGTVPPACLELLIGSDPCDQARAKAELPELIQIM